MRRRLGPSCALLLLQLTSCREVAEVLRADTGAGGASSAAGAPSGSDAGDAATGGARPLDPRLGIFVDSGDAHGCATRYGGLYCWGAGADGRLGLGDTEDRNVPTRVGVDADWVTVATGVAHSCALKTDGRVWCFGANTFGQLGQGSTESSSVPVLVQLPGEVRQLSSEANTACAVLVSGELYCWGRNWEGNIGLDDTHPGVDQLWPVRSGDGSDWKLTGTGDGHTCAVREPGLLFGWGRNTAANLGLGQTRDQQRRVATRIGDDDDWQLVVSGQDSSCGIRAAGELFCWGGNSFGNLGLGDTAQRLVPTQVEAAQPERVWQQVAIDTFHGCGIDSETNLYCWGRGLEGQLGTSDDDEHLLPALVAPGFAQVAAGRMSSCAVSVGGAVLCAGENDAGQLGVGDSERRPTFTELTFPDARAP